MREEMFVRISTQVLSSEQFWHRSQLGVKEANLLPGLHSISVAPSWIQAAWSRSQRIIFQHFFCVWGPWPSPRLLLATPGLQAQVLHTWRPKEGLSQEARGRALRNFMGQVGPRLQAGAAEGSCCSSEAVGGKPNLRGFCQNHDRNIDQREAASGYRLRGVKRNELSPAHTTPEGAVLVWIVSSHSSFVQTFCCFPIFGSSSPLFQGIGPFFQGTGREAAVKQCQELQPRCIETVLGLLSQAHPLGVNYGPDLWATHQS